MERVLQLIPAWITGRIGPRARREVRSWTRGNATLRTYRYDPLRRLLIWGTDHPVVFAALVGLVAAAAAYLLAVQQWAPSWGLPAPQLKTDFDVAAYAGVPWSVQATLVALVYPIVLSFIALMLQRKAHSTVSLRVYILDSAVVPAGASSLGLLLAMGAQYFATPYSSSSILAKFMAPLLAMNGTWLFVNVLLTGFFLSRTIRFIQEEEQRYAYTRIAVDVALRAELIAAVKQHIFVNAPQSDWGFPEIRSDDSPEPRVYSFSLRQGQPAVKRDIKGSLVLHDVHLRLLHLVAVLWRRRAAISCANHKEKAPTLIFPAMVGGEPSREVVLCSIEDGPPLRWYEWALIRLAFVYKPVRAGTLSLTTRRMLEEIGGEVESAAEQQRFGAAEERLREVLRLHRTLLLAGAADAEGLAGNAATIGVSPYAWGHSSFDMEWLKPYRDVGRIAVNRLEDDPRLFRVLAVVPASIASMLPPRPEKLLINAQLVGTNLAYQLAGWWTKKADASLVAGATKFSGTLPAPLSKVYEQAVIGFVGSWGHFSVDVPKEFRGGDVVAWQSLTGRALVYATHIEHSAELFLKAVSRGDETGSVWLLENFLKWWGNRQHELECVDIEHDFRVRHATVTLADKDWEAAKAFLWDGSEPVTIEFARKALNLAIRRYWESVRLYLVLVLIQNAGDAPSADSRELRFAAALVAAKAQRAGGSVDARPLDNPDDVLTRLMGTIFGIEAPTARIDAFADRLRWDTQTPEVSGWIYSWSGTPTQMESMRVAQAILLVALAGERRTGISRCKRLIERWWKDIDKLEQVQRYLIDLRKEVLGGAFTDRISSVSVLQAILGKVHQPKAGRLAGSIALKKLRTVAAHERRISLRALTLDVWKIKDMGNRIAVHAFNPASLPPPVRKLSFIPGGVANSMRTSFTDDRQRYLERLEAGPDTGLAEHVGDWIRQHLVAWSFGKLVTDLGLTPVNPPELRKLYDATHAQMRDYLSTVAAQCSYWEALGPAPVVLVGRSAARTLLSPYKWGVEGWKCLPPEGILVGTGEMSHPKAVSTINGVPVFEFDTPGADCYVLQADMLGTLAVDGVGASNALTIDWEEESEERLKFNIEWRAGFV
ncbi:hypothetical protein [Hydrogenophaga sp. R2]|uniref:hypothetical protein n=1 Tax=Hydrogenophaga sp. R2 TaxID=3132827 RepID=UPI003CE84A96